MTKKRLGAGAVVATAALAGMGLTAVPAAAAPGDQSNASAQFISGSLLDALDLSAIAGVAGTEASNAGVSEPVIDTTDLDVTALSAIQVEIDDGISLPLGDLLALGAVNQYSEARDAGVSLAASGAVSDAGVVDTSGSGDFPADASLNLMALLPENPALSSASLTLGAVTGVAALDAAQADGLAEDCTDLSAPVHCRDYQIADATIDVASPLLGDIVTTTHGALDTLGTTLEGLSNSVIEGLLGGVTSALGILNDLVPGLSLVSNDLEVELTADLGAALDPVLNEVRSAGGVTLNLSTGTVAVDLAELVDVNNLDPNTPLLSEAVLSSIGTQVGDLLTDLQDEITAVLDGVLDNVGLTISGGVCLLEVVVCTAGLNISFDGSLGDLLDGTEELTITGSGALALLDPVLTPLLAAVTSGLTDVVEPIVNGALSTAGSAISGVVSAASSALSPVFGLIDDVVSVNINVQEDDGAGTYTEIAAQLTLIGGSGATVNLGQATVGPNEVAAYDTSIEVEPGSIAQGETATVTGSGFEPGETVTVTLDGETIGTATAEEDGSFTLDYTAAEDAETGDFVVEAVGAESNVPATGSLEITEGDAGADPEADANADADVDGDENTNASASASASANADDESNAAAQVAAQAAATADADTTASAAADADATAAAQSAANEDASSDASADVSSDVNAAAQAAAQATSEADATSNADASSAADANASAAAAAAANADSSSDASSEAAADADADADVDGSSDDEGDVDGTSDDNAGADVDGSSDDEGDVNANASSSASASANADDESNASAQAAAQAAANADADTAASAAADADATAAAQSAATADASTDASADVSSDVNASAQAAAQAAANADASSTSNADASSAADANASAAAAAASNADSSADASSEAAANADADADVSGGVDADVNGASDDNADADVNGSSDDEGDVNANASSSASASANADDESNASAQAAAQAAANADADTAASAAADADATAAAQSAATADASTDASADVSSDVNASAQAAAQAAANADASSASNAEASAEADASANAASASQAAANADSSSDTSSEASASSDSDASASASASSDDDANASSDADASASSNSDSDSSSSSDSDSSSASNANASSAANGQQISMELENDRLMVGQEQVAHGHGFQPGESVTATQYSTPYDIGTSVADDNGDVTFTWSVPNGTEDGNHTVELTGETSGSVDASFEVYSTGGGGLSPTGGDMAVPLGGLAIAMLLAGAGVWFVTRRRANA
ncbi:MAG: choice-of-anchor G family protein [Candidatus Microbacterium stercoravium]